MEENFLLTCFVTIKVNFLVNPISGFRINKFVSVILPFSFIFILRIFFRGSVTESQPKVITQGDEKTFNEYRG